MLLGGKKAHMSDLEIKMTAGFMALRPASLYISIFLPSAASTMMLLMMKERENLVIDGKLMADIHLTALL